MIIVDARSPVPPFEQVRTQLARQIHEGILPAGTRLPTIRRLAADLGLAINTVGRAYHELENAGLVEARGRRGTFVTAGGQYHRERARQAAQQYVATISALGLDLHEARRIIEAALDALPGTAGLTHPAAGTPSAIPYPTPRTTHGVD